MKLRLPTTLEVTYTLGGIAAIWEIWTIINKTVGDTFSATLQALGENQPFIPFMMGMLGGHLWRNPVTRWAVILGFVAGVLFWPLLDKAEIQATEESAS